MSGREGNLEHQEIMRLIRTQVMPLLYERGFPYAGIFTFETPWAYKLGYTQIKTKGNEYPDAILCSRYIPQEVNTDNDKGEFIIIEIGNYYPSKWPYYPVLHIDKKNRHITSNRFTGGVFEFEVSKAIQEALNDDFSYSINGLPIEELRKLAILSLIGVGVSSGELEHLQWKDIDLTNGFVEIHDEEDGKTLYSLRIKLPPFLRPIIEEYKKSINEMGISVTEYDYFTVNIRQIKTSNTLNGITRRAIEKDIAKLFGFSNGESNNTSS